MHLLICTACACFHSAIVSSFNRNPTGPAKPQTFTIWPRPVTACQRWPKAVSHNLFSNGGLWLFIKIWYISCQRRIALKITTGFYRNRTLDFYMQRKRWLPILKSIYRTQFFKAAQNLWSERKVTLSCLQVLCWMSLRGGSEVENFEGKAVMGPDKTQGFLVIEGWE